MQHAFFKLTAASAVSLLSAAALRAETNFRAEAGVSYFALHGARFENQPAPLALDQDGGRWAPFVAGSYAFTERVGVRLSYHYVHNLSATAEYGYPPGPGDVHPQVVTWGHYDDDIHLVTLAPQLKWAFNDRVSATVAPGLNWVASRGTVGYSTLNPAVTLPARRGRNESGLTLGAAAGLAWAVGEQGTFSLSYQWVDLDPSWNREAHVFSGGLGWQF